MASITGSTAGSSPEARGQVTYRRVAGSEQRAALALLLTGTARGSDPAVDQFLQFAHEQDMSVRDTWAALRDGRAVASVLLVPAAGRSAMVFPSAMTRREQVPVLAELIQSACQAQDPHAVRLIQALLEPPQEREAQAFAQAGFARLATLIYEQRRTEPGPPTLDLPAPVQARTWSEAARPLFERAILASYEQTLDCPDLVGVRDIGDIIAGHMAAGDFRPELWLVLHVGDEPVGVMLLNPVPQRQAMELVYLGLSLPWRGRGLGRRLLHYALGQAHRHEAQTLLLAVDESNAPARELYASEGFVPTARKLAMIYTPQDDKVPG